MSCRLFAMVQDQPAAPRQRSPFAGTTCLTIAPPCCGGGITPCHLSVYGEDGPWLHACHDRAADSAIYLWGRVFHPSGLVGEPLLREIRRLVDEGPPDGLRELLGHFVILIDDRRRARISVISDVLGVRPWFVGSFNGRLVMGSDVLDICEAGLSTGKANLDALSSWLNYNVDCSGGSIVEDYQRITPGSITTYDHGGRLLNQVIYAPIQYSHQPLQPGQMIEALHDVVSRSFRRMVGDLQEINLPLSGGYDSRYLCALAAQRSGRLRVRLTNVETDPCEGITARQTAEALGLPLRIIPVKHHVLDLFDDPFPFGGDGFPIGRNLTNAVARLHPGMPLVSGFLGDVLMRAPIHQGLSDYLAQDEQNRTDDQYTASAYNRCRFTPNRIDLLRDPIAGRARGRAMQVMQRLVRQGRAAGSPMAFVNLYVRHRLYFANIFLSHLDIAEALLPFYSWELIDYRIRHASSFRSDNYRLLFQRYFPELAQVPHNSQFTLPNGRHGHLNGQRPTRHLRAWSADLLRRMIHLPGDSTAIKPRKLLVRLPGALLAESRHQTELLFLHKVSVLEQRLRRANIRVDWDRL